MFPWSAPSWSLVVWLVTGHGVSAPLHARGYESFEACAATGELLVQALHGTDDLASPPRLVWTCAPTPPR